MKLIHLTDPHFIGPGQRLYGLDLRARLDAALADINSQHGDAELMVITGDLTHWGEAEAYENLWESLAQLTLPWVPILGNHDNREAFLASFPDSFLDPDGFVQGRRECPAGTLLFLDTLQAGTHAGDYCEKRLAWLDSQLSSGPGPFFIFMHHPPFAVGVVGLDRIGLVQANDFKQVVRPHAGKIRHLFYGHVHRPICGSWLGIPHSTLRGTAHQVWLDLSPESPGLTYSYEEPAYAVVLIDDDSVVIHSHDYLYDKGLHRSLRHASPAEARDYALSFKPRDR